LELEKLDKALKISANSKDPDLVYKVIRHLKNKRSGKELELALQKIPHIFAMYKSLTRDENPDELIKLAQQTDDFRQQAVYYISSFYRNCCASAPIFEIAQHTAPLEGSIEALNACKMPTLGQLMTQHKSLVQANFELDDKHRTELVHKTLRETFVWAVANNFKMASGCAYAEFLRKQHKVNEKQYWRWTVAALADAFKWDALEHFVREHKSPVGYLPLIKAFAKHGQYERALKFIHLVPPDEQVQAYCLIGDIRKAAAVAASRQDLSQLYQLRLQQPEESENYSIVKSVLDKIQSGSQASGSARD